MTIREAFDDFMFEQRVRNNSPATITFYSSALSSFVDWVSRSAANVGELTIKQYKDYIIFLSSSGIKSTSVNTNLRAVKAFYNYLIDEEIIGDCSRKLKLIKQQKEEISFQHYNCQVSLITYRALTKITPSNDKGING